MPVIKIASILERMAKVQQFEQKNFERLEIPTYLHPFIYTKLCKTSMHIASLQLSVFLYFNILKSIEVQTSTLIDKGNQ